VTPAGNPVISKSGRNALVTSLLVCVGLFACWSPVQIMYVLNFLGHPLDFGGWLHHTTLVLVITNNCINPFIYAAKYRIFQEGVKSLLKKMRQGHQQSQVSAIV